MTSEQARAVNLAIGRVFSMASRPEQPGDGAEYWRCRNIVLDILGDPEDRSICFARDRGKGAQGQW